MNAWFDRLRAGILAELGSEDPAIAASATLSGEEARALLDLARHAAHGSGARHFAPLATYLAGRLIEATGAKDEPARIRLIAALARASQQAGPVGEDASNGSAL